MRTTRIIASMIVALVVLAVAVKIDSALSERSRYSRVREEISELEKQLDEFYLDNGNYPETEQGLGALSGFDELDIDPGIMRPRRLTRPNVPRDPWCNPFTIAATARTMFSGHSVPVAGEPAIVPRLWCELR
jgi:general secretion pathway protein G